MLENLLAYGLNNGNENGPTVETALSEIEQIIRSFSKEGNGFKEIAENLKFIKQTVEQKEKDFYKKIGVNDYSELNAKIQALESKYNIFLPDGAIMREIREKFDFTKVKNATDEELAEAVADTVNDFLALEVNTNHLLVDEVLTKSTGSPDGILAFLQRNLTIDMGEGSKAKRFITSRTIKGVKQKVGLGRIITHYDSRTRSVKVAIENIKNISSGFRKKLEDDLTQISEKINNSNSKKINVFELAATTDAARAIYRDYVNSIILKHLKVPMDILAEQYDLNRSISSTIGYLGEIRATLFMKELAPNVQVRATGNLRTAVKGQEIPIDLICAANGFQIKNYQLDNNSVTFSNSMLAPNWVEGRLKLTGTIAQALIGLFGIYQYNQPLSESINNSGKPPADLPLYQSIYMQIEYMFNDLKSLFDARIPEMLKIVDEFSVQGDPLLHSQKLYFNTFFWINRYLVPASWILDELIKGLKQINVAGGVIQSAYSFRKSDHSDLRFQKKGYKHQHTGQAPATMRAAAEKVRASYQITIDLSRFANLRF